RRTAGTAGSGGPAEAVGRHVRERLAVAVAAEGLQRVDEGFHVDAHASGPLLGARVGVVADDLEAEGLAVEEGAQRLELVRPEAELRPRGLDIARIAHSDNLLADGGPL